MPVGGLPSVITDEDLQEQIYTYSECQCIVKNSVCHILIAGLRSDQ